MNTLTLLLIGIGIIVLVAFMAGYAFGSYKREIKEFNSNDWNP